MMPLRVTQTDLRYTGIVGTGGLGSGKFFMLDGEHTLGREESRSGCFLDVRDYCKQHIILHYIKVLLGPAVAVLPIGKLGDDDIGKNLFDELKATGFEMDFVHKVPGISTLFSFCFHYPNGGGGNLTTNDSASAHVDEAFIKRAEEAIRKFGRHGIVMSAPEVPLSSRVTLLQLGRTHGALCCASFTSGEIQEISAEVFHLIDLLAINLDEAAAFVGRSQGDDPKEIVTAVIDKLRNFQSAIKVSVTAGKNGSWCWDGTDLTFCSAINTKVKSTAGAGDAFFSGLIAGLAMGRSLYQSQFLATLVAGASVTSPHTIHPTLDGRLLHTFCKETAFDCPSEIMKLLQ